MCIVCFAGQSDEHAGAAPCNLKCLCITKTICVLKCYNSQKKKYQIEKNLSEKRE